MKFKGIEPLAIIEVDDTYILAVYQGFLSEYDLLIKYRQSDKSTKSHYAKAASSIVSPFLKAVIL